LALGHKSLKACQQAISSAEFAEWQAYYRLEPFGEERADLRTGILAALIANVNRDPKQRKKPYEPADFMPTFDKQSKATAPQSIDEQLMIIEMLNIAFGGDDLRGKP